MIYLYIEKSYTNYILKIVDCPKVFCNNSLEYLELFLAAHTETFFQAITLNRLKIKTVKFQH